MYEPRTYRNNINSKRFKSFTVSYKETDLQICTDYESFNHKYATLVTNEIINLRAELTKYINKNPDFKTSLLPITATNDASENVKSMILSSAISNTGPMSAVAGTFAQVVANKLLANGKFNELIVENGGDLFVKTDKSIAITIVAGNSCLSKKIALVIPSEYTPLGVCTSSGTSGHSFSFGKADAVTVVCKSPILADAFATAIANKIKRKGDINNVLDYYGKIKSILSLIIIKDEIIGIKGKFKIKINE
ncbi:MAG: UPF0280 family protein [Bacteroidetes bacterium]|nr:MAG: UPF0280 family protein [Bacteroidota bacterium]